jgi:hypothetical protein
VLRAIIGKKSTNEGQYLLREKNELYQVFQEPDIAEVVRYRRLAWAAEMIITR